MSGYGSGTLTQIHGSSSDNYQKIRITQPKSILNIKHFGDENEVLEVEKKIFGDEVSEMNEENGLILKLGGDNKSIFRQTRKYIRCEQGNTLSIYISARMNMSIYSSGNVDPSVTYVGYLDDNNGFMFAFKGDDALGMMVIRTLKNGTSTDINNGNWNIDNLDGNGPSGVTVDWKHINTFYIEISNPMTCKFGIIHNGRICVAHIINGTSGILPASYLLDLPIRYGVSKVAGPYNTIPFSAGMTHYSTLVTTDGDYNPYGRLINFKFPETMTFSNTEKPIMTFCLRSNNLGVVTRRITSSPLKLILTSNDAYKAIYTLYFMKAAETAFNYGISLTPLMKNDEEQVEQSEFTNLENTNLKYYMGIASTKLNTTILYPMLFKVYEGIFTHDMELDIDDLIKKHNIYFDLSSNSDGLTDYIVLSCKVISGINIKSVDGLITLKEIMHE
jgi:hypothetical protein